MGADYLPQTRRRYGHRLAGAGLLQALPQAPPGTRSKPLGTPKMVPLLLDNILLFPVTRPFSLKFYKFKLSWSPFSITIGLWRLSRLNGSNKRWNGSLFILSISPVFIKKVSTVQYPHRRIVTINLAKLN